MLCLIFRKNLKWYIENFCYLVQFTDFFCLPACLSIVCNAQGTWIVEKDTNSLKCIKISLLLFQGSIVTGYAAKGPIPNSTSQYHQPPNNQVGLYIHPPPLKISCSSTS